MTTAETEQPPTPRVRIETEGDRTVFSVAWWPGWGKLRNYLFFLVFFGIITAILTVVRLGMAEGISNLEHLGWAGRILGFLVAGGLPIFFELIFVFLILIAPLYVIDELSGKRVWFETDALCVNKTLGRWRRCRRIPRDRILDIKLGRNGSAGRYLYDVQVVYRLELPLWLPDLLVDRVDRWGTILLNAIPDRTEAEAAVEALLGPLTNPAALLPGSQPP